MMMASAPNARSELREIASIEGCMIGALNHLHPLAAEPFDEVCRFAQDGRAISWATNGTRFLIEVGVSTSLTFAAGRPDVIVAASQPVLLAGTTLIYQTTNFPIAWPAASDQETLIAALIAALDLGSEEQLLVARNKTTLLVEPHGTESDSKRLASLLALVAALPPFHPPGSTGEVVEGLRFDDAKIPSKLQGLLPMLRVWAVGDDQVRSERIRSAPDGDLRDLVGAVAPLLIEIDALIAAENGVGSDEAVLLGDLAQAVLEAKQELERRPSA
jgi:hypothetical protein